MYNGKIRYFDASVNASWAAKDYVPEEMTRLDRLFEHTGSIEGFRVLEPGCGTGRLTEILSDRVGSKGLIVALDISPKMAEAAKYRNSSRHNVCIHQAPVEDFPIEDDEYDLILCHQVFPHFEDKKRVLKALSKSLRIMGRIIVIHFINLKEINDTHRKAGTAVENDMMPDNDEVLRLFDATGLDVEFMVDDNMGYFLSAIKA